MHSEAIDALPVSDEADKGILRNFLIQRVTYMFSDGEDPQAFDAIDAETGTLPNALGFDGGIFFLDPDDTTSAHDGVTVIVTNDGYRYKAAGQFDFRSVLSSTATAPPGSPALGDKYLIPSGATGAWSSHQDDLTVWTGNGWKFNIPVIGQWVLDESTDGYLRYTSTGWLKGAGTAGYSAASVPFSAALGWGARFEVENQTTTTPPTAIKGLRYIVGNSATGAWLGKDKQIAICEVAGSWTFYAPGDGYEAYDKSNSSIYRYSTASLAWISAGGSWIDLKSTGLTVSGTTTAPTGSTYYTYSSGTGPTTSHRRLIDGVSLSFAAKKAGAKIRVHYSANAIFTLTNALTTVPTNSIVLALYQDSASNAIAWALVDGVKETLVLLSQMTSPALSITANFENWFEVVAPDASSHTYTIAITSANAFSQTMDAGSLTRRTLTIEEAA